ncbi:fimbrial protein [Erwinia persicina]|uniref:fimbrial protein n=1 Tax=Erwinia persicina TaxID=55211 RepID=UPI00177E39C3|nr:fimbrial protein [Erwinia persicina]MBD8162260.1 type 1 fimbrial protein [Erwinia persicina]MBD8215090.1 type 1 fimbrial protein [Erwinia persicina]
MKKVILSAILPVALFSSMSHATTSVSGGTINFSGAVTDATCTINGNNSANLSVALNPISTEQAGTAEGLIDVGKKAFSLDFSNCSSANIVKAADGKTPVATPSLQMQFSSPNTISNDGKYLINQENNPQGNPRNVGIAIVLQKTETQPIMLNQMLDTKLAGTSATPDTINFYAKYYKVGTQPAEAGVVRTMVTYNITYL